MTEYRIGNAAWLAMAALLVAFVALAAHKPSLRWMAPYKGVANVPCCDELDCIPAAVALVPLPAKAGHIWVSVDGVVMEVPVKAVHESETTEAYWCYRAEPDAAMTTHDGQAHYAAPPVSLERTRCVFYATGW